MKYERLKITAVLKNNVVINNEMFLDGILYFALRKKQENDYYNLPRFSEKKQNLNIRLPIKKKCNAYLASRAYYRIVKEYVDNFHRRFNEVDAVEWLEKKRVYLDQKKTKNWRKPLNVTVVKNNEIYWYVIGDRKKIEELLNIVKGIGKEISIGYGTIDYWKIESTTKKGTRLFPSTKNGIVHAGFKPPYSSLKNKAMCRIHRF